MHKGQTTTRTGLKAGNTLVLITFITMSALGSFISCKSRARVERNTKDTAIVLPYHTIAKPGVAGELYAYELHKRKMPQTYDTEYCAVIRNLDPQSDDYKAYCKTVIADIIHCTGTDQIMIGIYDSYEAYELYEIKFLQRFANLTSAEMATVGEHYVATYSGGTQDVDCISPARLAFYEYKQNGLVMSEEYRPDGQ